MSILAISLGLIARTVLLIGTSVSRADIINVGFSLFFGVMAAGKGKDWMFFPVVFAGCIGFLYRDRIMPVLTEGTILLYSLVGLFIVLTFEPIPIMHLNESIFAFLILTTVMMLALCVTKIRIPFALQVLLVVAFLATSVYIGYQSTLVVMISDTTIAGQFLLGFFGLQFASYCLYILNFIPIPLGKHQSFSERWRNVKAHAAFLEEKYRDIDLHGIRTIGIIAVVAGLIVYARFSTDLVTGIAVALTIGSMVASSGSTLSES